jgi:hypothetical protein
VDQTPIPELSASPNHHLARAGIHRCGDCHLTGMMGEAKRLVQPL